MPAYPSSNTTSTTLAKHLAALAARTALLPKPVLQSAPDPETVTAVDLEPIPDTDADSGEETEEEDEPSFQNPAVARCHNAWSSAFAEGSEIPGSFLERQRDAKCAYRRSMPALAGRQNIADFVACVAKGMLLDVFADGEATRLLYAAQVAYTTSPAPLSAPKPPLPDRRIHRKKNDLAS